MCFQEGKSAVNYVNNIKRGLDILREEVRLAKEIHSYECIHIMCHCVCIATKDLCQPGANP